VNLNDYQAQAARTRNQEHAPGDKGVMAINALGIAGEAGEVAELVKKHIGHGHVLDVERVKKELGDVLWYVAAIATDVCIELDDVAATNIAKLRARYPEGFDPSRSQNRAQGDT
jgi:NTP pyrophosphatase (non-canonical NTP hydrolase)